MENKLTHPFEATLYKDTNILILGSFPSVISRERNYYYMNKNNRFYKVLSAIFDEDFYNCDVNTKKELLKKHHIGLYDVIKNCYIEGSNDASISDASVNNIDEIVNTYPIKKIICNGSKSYSLFLKYFPNLAHMCVMCPSTSSANANYSLDDLIKHYYKAILQ